MTVPQDELKPGPAHNLPQYLKSIHAVRERCTPVFEAARENQLQFFDVRFEKVPALVEKLGKSIKAQCNGAYATIPPHGRWQHFEMDNVARLDALLMPENEGWPPDKDEATRRILDLFLVSVLLDAGAGNSWRYKSREGITYSRSEGLAVASFEMFTKGFFSSEVDKGRPMQVDAEALAKLDTETMLRGLQLGKGNEMDGFEGRTGVLRNLSKALAGEKRFFGEKGRPGCILDYIRSHPMTRQEGVATITPLTVLWEVLVEGLAPVWPKSRTVVEGVAVGDAWPLHVRGRETIVPFHKLTQWLTYSLMVPLKQLQNITFEGEEMLTGLPEYRNGGLLIDYGVLALKADQRKEGIATANANPQGENVTEIMPTFRAEDEVVVEWRAVTVGFLDYLLVEVNKYLELTDSPEKLTLAQMLEAGTWKLGRQVAAEKRPGTKGPPIMIVSDGTVF